MIPIGDTRRRFGFPWMTVVVLLICLFFFLYERRVPLEQSGLVLRPWALAAGSHLFLLRNVLTSIVVQGAGWLRPIVNLVYLGVLGSKVEDACGPWGLLCITVLSALGGAAIRMIVTPLLAGPFVQDQIYGLTGVVAGLLGAYMVLYAFGSIPSWVPPFVVRLTPVPVVVHLLYWGALVFVNINLPGLQSGQVLQAVPVAPTWPMAGALFVGLIVGQLFARREYLWLRVVQAKRAAARR